MKTWNRNLGRALFASLPMILLPAGADAQQAATSTQWYGQAGGKAMQRYSPADEITADNFDKLEVLWTRPAVDKTYTDEFPDISPSRYLHGSPTVVDGTAYVSNGVGLVEAFDAATGATKWVQTPMPVDLKRMVAESVRSVEYWASGDDKRIISVRGPFLHALDARTGKPAAGFGDNGAVFLGWPTKENVYYRNSSGPLVVGDVIVVGGMGGVYKGGYGDSGDKWEGSPDNIRGYDVRTGHLLWTFHVVPQPGEPGAETWKSDAWKDSGAQGAWAPLSADEKLGLVYIPLSAPTLYYGGHREGDNLYGSSLVALDARTGKLAWHFQTVHHDIWDYDMASPPVLGDLIVGGKKIPAVMAAGKTGFVYVFDRATGKPVWPIVEREVPQSDTPGEYTSPTQPFPSKPPPFDMQGVSKSDLNDLTPEVRKEARNVAKNYRLGPLFTPPSLIREDGTKGTLASPGVWGSGNWNTGAFDPETNRYYAISRTMPTVYSLVKAPAPDATIEYIVPRIRQPGDVSNRPQDKDGFDHGGLPVPPAMPSGLPIVKPPYGRITAYDMNKGDKLWSVANGDDEKLLANPALQGVKNLPRLGTASRVPLTVTKTLLLVPDGSTAVSRAEGYDGPAKFRAFDKSSGEELAAIPMPAGATAAPVTYDTPQGQRILVAVSSKDGSYWIAYGLKKPGD